MTISSYQTLLSLGPRLAYKTLSYLKPQERAAAVPVSKGWQKAMACTFPIFIRAREDFIPTTQTAGISGDVLHKDRHNPNRLFLIKDDRDGTEAIAGEYCKKFLGRHMVQTFPARDHEGVLYVAVLFDPTFQGLHEYDTEEDLPGDIPGYAKIHVVKRLMQDVDDHLSNIAIIRRGGAPLFVNLDPECSLWFHSPMYDYEPAEAPRDAQRCNKINYSIEESVFKRNFCPKVETAEYLNAKGYRRLGQAMQEVSTTDPLELAALDRQVKVEFADTFVVKAGGIDALKHRFDYLRTHIAPYLGPSSEASTEEGLKRADELRQTSSTIESLAHAFFTAYQQHAKTIDDDLAQHEVSHFLFDPFSDTESRLEYYNNLVSRSLKNAKEYVAKIEELDPDEVEDFDRKELAQAQQVVKKIQGMQQQLTSSRHAVKATQKRSAPTNTPKSGAVQVRKKKKAC